MKTNKSKASAMRCSRKSNNGARIGPASTPTTTSNIILAIYQRQHGLLGMGETKAAGEQRKILDQGQPVECQHVYLPGTTRYGGGRFRARLQQQQPVQPNEETPILDQERQPLENHLRRSRIT